MKAIVAYDGTLDAKDALKYAIRKVCEKGGEIVTLCAFDRDLFVTYDAVPRVEDVARRDAERYIEEARSLLRQCRDMVKAYIVEVDGNPERETISLAKSENADIIFVPRRYRAVQKKAKCPVVVIPGTLLVPVDHTTSDVVNLDQLIQEAQATRSTVVLLGLVPEHLYNSTERAELDRIMVQTQVTVKSLASLLAKNGIKSQETIRSGYPDEEILRVAEDRAVSMIVFLKGNHKSAELTKAETIITDDSAKVRVPVFSVLARWQPGYLSS
jgi:hypothetical protein